MKVKINHSDNDLWCLYLKEKIGIGEKYVEVVEQYLGEEIVKTYGYEYLDDLVDEYLESYDIPPDIFGDE